MFSRDDIKKTRSDVFPVELTATLTSKCFSILSMFCLVKSRVFGDLKFEVYLFYPEIKIYPFLSQLNYALETLNLNQYFSL